MLEFRAYGRMEGQVNDGLQHNQTRPHDPEVMTEDPHFGSFPFHPSEVYTSEEQEVLRVQNERQELRQVRDEDTRAQEKADENLEKEAVLQQLKRKIFPWETEWTIAGILTDERGLPNGNFYRVREDNEKWQRLAERQAVLDAGGEAAKRILLEEVEEELDEEKKERRRDERRRQIARKRAKAAGMLVDETRLSGWVPEE